MLRISNPFLDFNKKNRIRILNYFFRNKTTNNECKFSLFKSSLSAMPASIQIHEKEILRE
jgi:hypothetical protein